MKVIDIIEDIAIIICPIAFLIRIVITAMPYEITSQTYTVLYIISLIGFLAAPMILLARRKLPSFNFINNITKNKEQK